MEITKAIRRHREFDPREVERWKRENIVHNVLKTLPIGFYTKTDDISVEMSEFAPTSHCNPAERSITIATGKLLKDAKTFDKTHDLEWQEANVREHLYHEVLHCMLTPISIDINELGFREVVNIFEDERIEFIGNGYFLNTDFERGRYILNGFADRKAYLDFIEGHPERLDIRTDPVGAFYALVRFRVGPEEFLKRVKDLVNKYKDLRADSKRKRALAYVEEIKKLYVDYTDVVISRERIIEIAKELKKKTEVSKKVEVGEIPGAGKGKRSGEGEPGEGESGESSSGTSGGTTPKDGVGGCGSSDEDGEPSDEDVADIMKKAAEAFSKIWTAKRLADQLYQIFELREKKLARRTSTSHIGQSGRLSERMYMDEDRRREWRVFEQRGGQSCGVGQKKIFLHLILDCSGSYSHNDDATNRVLQAVREAAKKLGKAKFDYDISSMGCEIEIAPDKEKYVHCSGGGNQLGITKTRNAVNKLHKADADEIFLLLADGDWMSNDCGCSPRGNEAVRTIGGRTITAPAAFNDERFFIISDPSNKMDIETQCPKAHVKYVSSDYPKILAKTIVELLSEHCR